MNVAISNDFLKAYSEVPKAQQKQVREFLEVFRENPKHPGINYESIRSAKDKHFYSVRVNQAYRAIVFHPPQGEVYVLMWVDHHDDAYQWAERKQVAIHPATGALQLMPTFVAEAAPVEVKQSKRPGLFDAVKDKHLLRLGIPEEFISSVRSVHDDPGLETLEKQLPPEAYEALFMLASGFSLDEVFREMEKAPEGIEADVTDFPRALEQDDSKRWLFVIDNDQALEEVLSAPLEQWRVFLHPKQRRLVEMKANGPVRVLGGAGTGKTIVAMHRARHLAENVFNQKNDRLLFTTFTKNLAVDIETSLRKICSPEALARIEVTNLDQWVSDYLSRNGYRQKALFDAEESEAWASALNQASPELDLSPGFYRSEWEQVVQGQGLTTEEAYVQAPRLGRGTRLSRDQRRKVWKVFQEYRAQLLEHGQKELVDMIRDCRQLIEKAGTPSPYRAVIVDEGQDFGNEAFRLIRALAPAGPNDLFIVGDAHQRIYRQEASLGKCGIDIRGRGKKLRLNYRTTAETQRFAMNLLSGLSADDLDEGKDDSKGILSLTHGSSPVVHEFGSPSEELTHLAEQISDLQKRGVPLSSICVAARTTKIRDQIVGQLTAAGFSAITIHGNKADRQSQVGVRVATLHRVKGLEFDYVFIVSANDGLVPPTASLKFAEDEVARQGLLKSERALLYVGASRARKGVQLSSSGTLSSLLRSS